MVDVMNEIAQVGQLPIVFNPHTPLSQRTEAWIIELYTNAQVLVEMEYAEELPELAPWKLLSDKERQVDAVEYLRGQKRDWNIQFQNIIDSKALEIADGLTEAIRTAVANIITSRKRKRLRWQKLKGIENVKQAARETIILPDGSAGRQISSLIENHLDDVEAAGVDESTIMELLSRPDKFLINTARAISRTKKDISLTENEKRDKVREIVEYAADTDRASNIRREFINGTCLQIPRDVVVIDGDTLVTFLCRDEQEFSTLDRKTETISAMWGNAQPILHKTQAARTRRETILKMCLVISILQAGDFTLEEIDQHIENPLDYLTNLEKCGMIEFVDEKYGLKGKP